MDDVRFWSEIESKKKEDKDTQVIYKDEKTVGIEWRLPTKLLGEK